MTFNKTVERLKKLSTYIRKSKNEDIFVPAYRVIDILQEEDAEYVVKIQIINKNITFNIKPEEILAKDDIVNMFSPCDIRTLTYLGYLGINAPKYKILAQHLCENNQKTLFALKKKGNDIVVTKTANEIIKEKDVLTSLNANDAHLVGYTLATEAIINEKQQKEELLKQLKDKSQSKN